jgi:trehalose 6-phosphate phosphatase
LTRPLFAKDAWARARALLVREDRNLLVALDLDGTVAPIAPRPELARVPLLTRRAIERAIRAKNTRVAVVSARPDRDLRRLVPVRNLLRIGQYGLEGPLAPPRRVAAGFRRRCARITKALRPLVRPVRGALLEPKGLTVAVHLRNVTERGARGRLRRELDRFAAEVAAADGFVPMPGAEIVDFVPRGHDKGRALRALARRLAPDAVVYFGDSSGDEPAFAVLGRGDMAVRVGRGETRAGYRVAGIAGVTRFLDAVTALRTGPA